MLKSIVIFTCLLPFVSFSQDVKGIVTDEDGAFLLGGANVQWIGTTIGTSTDVKGVFELSTSDIEDKRLIVSYLGYETDTVFVGDDPEVVIRLRESVFETIELTADRPGSFISSLDPIKTEVITQGELEKSACCDLAGCFNTQASVQPTTTNIVTNAKELRILGLSGVYNQVLVDGMPLIQGLSYTYGISGIPGTLVDNIFVAKGANSVLQGFESISGQINVIPKKPENTEKLLLNVYMNSFLEKQFNANYSHKWKKWSTLLAAHSTQPGNKFDRDNDKFLDLPLISRYSVYNKWNYGSQKEKGFYSMFAFKYLNEQRIGGQIDFDRSIDEGSTRSYGQTVQISQPEFYSKTGFRINDKHNVAFFASGLSQDQLSYYGTTRYKAKQVSAYANLQYELSWAKNHSFKTGFSFRHLNINEDISFAPDSLNRTYSGMYSKNEQILGVFAENTFNWGEKTTLIAGLRLDHHNQFGLFATPRALLKHNFSENTIARVSVGTGWRTVNLFSENVNLLASSRDVIISEGLRPEQAINYGANITHKVYGEKIESQISVDFYRTQFSNQIFPDYDTPTKAYVSNFNGTSISNGLQIEANFEIIQRVGIKVAYNYLDVFRIINDSRFDLPFNSKHRITSTASYKPLSKKWHIDLNAHWNGVQRLAKTSDNPIDFQMPETSKPYMVINAQFTKSWKRLDLYGGCENIFNVRQNQPILSWQNPFGPYFDTSSVWGPTRGREFYIGLRYKID